MSGLFVVGTELLGATVVADAAVVSGLFVFGLELLDATVVSGA